MSKETLLELIEKHGAFVSPDGRSVFIAGDWYNRTHVETFLGEKLGFGQPDQKETAKE